MCWKKRCILLSFVQHGLPCFIWLELLLGICWSLLSYQIVGRPARRVAFPLTWCLTLVYLRWWMHLWGHSYEAVSYCLCRLRPDPGVDALFRWASGRRTRGPRRGSALRCGFSGCFLRPLVAVVRRNGLLVRAMYGHRRHPSWNSVATPPRKPFIHASSKTTAI